MSKFLQDKKCKEKCLTMTQNPDVMKDKINNLNYIKQ